MKYSPVTRFADLTVEEFVAYADTDGFQHRTINGTIDVIRYPGEVPSYTIQCHKLNYFGGRFSAERATQEFNTLLGKIPPLQSPFM